jgi:hypothetical protein
MRLTGRLPLRRRGLLVLRSPARPAHDWRRVRSECAAARFQETTVFTGLTGPSAIEFASDAVSRQWGDGCPTPPGATGDGCVVSARLLRLTAAGNQMTGPEQALSNAVAPGTPSGAQC